MSPLPSIFLVPFISLLPLVIACSLTEISEIKKKSVKPKPECSLDISQKNLKKTKKKLYGYRSVTRGSSANLQRDTDVEPSKSLHSALKEP